MKDKLVLTILIATIGVLFVTGCCALNTGNNTSVQNEPVTSTEPAVDPDGFLADAMSINSEDAKELYIMRIKDSLCRTIRNR